MIEQLLAPLTPNEVALAALFRANVDDAMLREIAEADYGWKADECYALLQPMLRTGQVALPDFQLQEVLELIRWSEPEDPEWKPGSQGRRGHWMRLFACTALVRLAPAMGAFVDTEVDTLAQLIDSAICLGPEVARAAASVLAWRFLAHPGEFENPAFLAFGILLLAAHIERGEDRGPWLKQLAAWVEDEEARARNEYSEHEWLMGLTSFRQRESVWRALARKVLLESTHAREAHEPLRLLGELVAAG